MKAEEYISTYGGKGGGWFFLNDFGGFEGHLLPLWYISPDMTTREEIKKALPQVAGENWLLRATHPNDHEGLVDVLLTKRIIGFEKHPDDVADIIMHEIEEIRDHANSQAVFEYNVYEGQSYDGRVGVAVQPFNPGKRGNVVEHPHERGTYLIDLVTSHFKDYNEIDRITVSGNGIDEHNTSLYVVRDYHRKLVEEIIDLYRRVRDTGFVLPDFSFQMEFGLNEGFFPGKSQILFYQARPFLRFQKADFSVDGRFKYRCFGITPKEGVVLPVVKTFRGEGVNQIDEDFAWFVPVTKQLPCYVTPRNMKAFIPLGLRVSSLEHNTFRWVRKAPVSVTDEYRSDWIEYTFRTRDTVRIVSDGLTYNMEKVN